MAAAIFQLEQSEVFREMFVMCFQCLLERVMASFLSALHWPVVEKHNGADNNVES